MSGDTYKTSAVLLRGFTRRDLNVGTIRSRWRRSIATGVRRRLLRSLR